MSRSSFNVTFLLYSYLLLIENAAEGHGEDSRGAQVKEGKEEIQV